VFAEMNLLSGKPEEARSSKSVSGARRDTPERGKFATKTFDCVGLTLDADSTQH